MYQGLEELQKASSLDARDALLDRDHLVRRQALWALDTIPGEYKEDVESMLSDASYVNIALALDALCKAFPDEKQRFIDKVGAVDNSTVKIYGKALYSG